MPDQKTKKCPKCGEEILASAKICKHCKSDVRSWFVQHPIVSFLLITFVVLPFMAGLLSGTEENKSTVKTTTVTPEIQTLKVGEEGIVNNNDDNKNCETVTVVGVTENDIKDYIERAVNDNTAGQSEMLLSGKIFFVNNCTPIKKTGTGGSRESLAKIKILDNTQELISMTGWIPYEFARKK